MFDDEELDLDVDEAEMMQFEWPRFGVSPGPTPSPSTISTISTPSSCVVSEVRERERVFKFLILTDLEISTAQLNVKKM